MSITDKLCEKYDQETLASNEKNKLYIVGNSPFTRAIKRKADQLGVRHFTASTIPNVCIPTIIDREVYRGEIDLYDNQDIDNLCHDGLSCCAQAILDTLLEVGVAGKSVTVIGRGHAVKGLAQTLIDHNATVTVAHSQTGNMYEAMLFANIVVVAAPIHTSGLCSMTGKVIVDVVGKCYPKGADTFVSDSDIGKLTTSIVLYRATGGVE